GADPPGRRRRRARPRSVAPIHEELRQAARRQPLRRGRIVDGSGHHCVLRPRLFEQRHEGADPRGAREPATLVPRGGEPAERAGFGLRRAAESRDRERTQMSLKPTEELEHLKLATELAGIAVPEIVLPERRHVVVDGMRLHYLDWG